jgi:hypothetical protein
MFVTLTAKDLLKLMLKYHPTGISGKDSPYQRTVIFQYVSGHRVLHFSNKDSDLVESVWQQYKKLVNSPLYKVIYGD